MFSVQEEMDIFRKRIDSGFYNMERAKNCGDDYVKSGKMDRDTEGVAQFVESDAFAVIRDLR